MNNILFFDLETTTDGKTISDIGAIYENNEYHENSLPKLQSLIKKSMYICGHNIIDHDIPILEKKIEKQLFDDKKIIDTLYLSPLLFPKKPYHALVKDYKLFDEKTGLNNPLCDSKLVEKLINDEIEAFTTLPDQIQKIYYHLLKKHKAFAGFFNYISYYCDDEDVSGLIRKLLNGNICSNCDIDNYITSNPLAIAYVTALLSTGCSESVIPPWVMNKFKEVNKIYYNMRFKPCDDEECVYCAEALDPQLNLRKFFGFDKFRGFTDGHTVPIQEQVVRNAIGTKSLIAVFPTGGGKSITFQLPALMFGEACRSLTVIISPLQALMKDQVDNLIKKGITKAVTINGMLSPLERSEAIERIENGEAHILYLSPESLRLRSIERLLKNRLIARFVIDEAHCFSSWGHDFRVDYLYIGEFIKNLQKIKGLNAPIPVSCFTATAKKAVLEDIKTYFKTHLDLELVQFQVPTKRKNLKYHIFECKDEADKLQKLIQIISQTKGAVIVYAGRTRTTEKIAEDLKRSGFEARYYHGKMDNEKKKESIDQFLADQVQVMVATSAFGMGVDKDDVSVVVHYDISDSLENYIQETGRAGRNPEIQADCYLLFNKDDIQKHFDLYYSSRINKKEIAQVWKGVKELAGVKKRINKSALEIAKAAGWDSEIYDLETKVKTAIAVLEDLEYVKRTYDSPCVYANSLLIRNVEEISRIIEKSDIFAEKDKIIANRIIQRIIKDDETRLDWLSDILAVPQEDVNRNINYLKEAKLIGDDKDLSLYVNTSKGDKSSIKMYDKYKKIEAAMVDLLTEQPHRVSLKELNSHTQDEKNILCSIDLIKDLLIYWDRISYIEKKRIDRNSQTYELKYHKNAKDLKTRIQFMHEISGLVLNYLLDLKSKELDPVVDSSGETLVEFSIVGLKKVLDEQNTLFKNNYTINQLEKSLLYLNSISAVRLHKGFIIMYRPMTIEKTEKNNRRQFTEKDYENLSNFYKNKIEQIHMILEYGEILIKNYNEAITFVDEYFTLNYDDFVNKYFPRRKGEISRPVTKEKFQKVFGDLSTDQLKIINDNKNPRILVTAGPGSGKTHVLVRKVASLLMMEDVKPEQFLMLTFSRYAAMEFRSRLKELIGNTAKYIDILTYHSYCFNLTGALADKDEFENIISDTVKNLKEGTISIESIKNTSVLVIDEFQDLTLDEYELINEIIKISGEIRVLAVGDDDQNIYEFRGATNECMRKFQQDGAVLYDLLTNYRSHKNLIEFSNVFVKNIKQRIKDQDIKPKSNENGTINIYKYNSKNLINPLSELLINNEHKGVTAVLTFTNFEAACLKTLLDTQNIKSRVLLSNNSFRIKDIAEIDFFTNSLSEGANSIETISREEWNEKVKTVKSKYASSSKLDFVLKVITFFSKSVSYITMKEWQHFICEMKIENFYKEDEELITISTMHKVKGKEFDDVYLLMDNYPLVKDEQKRLLYVALTRAKQNLHIVTNSDTFKDYNIQKIKYETINKVYNEPPQISFYLHHDDIFLDYHINERVASIVNTLCAGERLYKKDNSLYLYDKENRPVCKFSKKFAETFNNWTHKGFAVKEAEVDYIVRWHKKDQEEMHNIVIPKIVLSK